MKNAIYYILFLLPLYFIVGCEENLEREHMLPNKSEWALNNQSASFIIRKDSFLWTLKSDIENIPPIAVSTLYQWKEKGRMQLHSNLPLLSGDLSYVYGKVTADIYEFMCHTKYCKLHGNHLILYASPADSLVFHRKQ